ncbi:MAG: hypothetical protein OXG53_02170 [Chloroflexi bacterium]|nr:hypothetical protein [Chloroflexota bacterium]
MTNKFDQVFSSVPSQTRKRLQKHFEKIRHDHALGRYESSELNGGKFCETVVLVLEWYVKSRGVVVGGKPTTRVDTRIRRIMGLSCKELLESFRLNVPDVLLSVLRIRNKRGVAHINGDVDPNYMDSTYVVAAANWVMAELVRVLYSVTLEEATRLVDRITTKRIPLVWEIGDRKRVISPPGMKLNARQKVLALLYNEYPEPMYDETLLTWTRYSRSNRKRFESNVLGKLDKCDQIDYDKQTGEVNILPPGLTYVEENILDRS